MAILNFAQGNDIFGGGERVFGAEDSCQLWLSGVMQLASMLHRMKPSYSCAHKASDAKERSLSWTHAIHLNNTAENLEPP